MALFFLHGKNIRGDTATFTDEEARHIKRVLRLKQGDTIVAFDDRGNRYHLTIVDETVKSVIAHVNRVDSLTYERVVEVLLGVGIPKGDRFDYILQKTTELGVGTIVPFLSSRTVVRVPPEKREGRHVRWRRIILETVKQCGASHIPSLGEIRTFQGALEYLSGCDLKIILYEETFEFSLNRILEKKGPVKSVALLVGPEGGFSKEEVKSAREKDFIVAGLGKNILRVETATIAALAMIQYRFENL
jgi:16S rRNA (uracil1498-N3)-methyltransferase